MSFNPLYIGSYCNLIEWINECSPNRVSIPFISGHIVIIADGIMHVDNASFNPLYIGSYCNTMVMVNHYYDEKFQSPLYRVIL